MDHVRLLETIPRVFPESSLEPVSEACLAAIREQHPGIPADYLDFLRRIGAGRLGRMSLAIYDGPWAPSEIFDEETAAVLDGLLFIADDFAGYNMGFDARSGWRIVGVSSAWPEIDPQPDADFPTFVERWAAERDRRSS